MNFTQGLSILKPGDHCLFISDGFDTKISVLSSYFKTGLKNNEKCVALLDGLSLDALKGKLCEAGVEVNKEIASGRLVLANSSDIYLNGKALFEPEKMLEVWDGILGQSDSEGFSALRVTGDVAWATGNRENLERLLSYERLVQGVFEASPRITALCVYEKGLFSKEALLEALKTHPLLIQNGTVLKNVFFNFPSYLSKELNILPDVDDYISGKSGFQLLETRKQQIDERYARLLSVIPGIIYRLNSDLSIDFLNEFPEELTGYTRKELADEHGVVGFFDLVHPEDRKAVLASKSKVSGTKRAAQVFRLIRKDGSHACVQDFSRDIFVRGVYSHTEGIILDITDRVRAEEKAGEIGENFRALVENANDGIVIAVGAEGHVYANRKAAAITGYSIEELLVTSFKTLIVPEEMDMLTERFRKRLAGEPVPSQYETCIISKNGKRVPLEITPALTTWCGQSAVMVILRDITERRLAEETIRKSEAHLKVAQHIAKMGSWEWDTVNDVVTWSDELHFMVSISKKAFGGTLDSAMDFVHPGDRESVRAAFMTSLSEGGRVFHVEHRLLRKNGSELMVCSEGWATEEVDGKPSVMSGVCCDITEAKRKEAELREAEAKYRALIAQLPSHLWIYVARLDELASTIYVSPQAESFGFSQDEWIKEKELWSRLLHPEDRGRVLREFEKRRATIEPFHMEYRMFTRDGRLRWVRDEAIVVRDISGKPLFFQGVLLDITERKKAEEEHNLLTRIASEILSVSDFRDMLTIVISRICKMAGWSMGEAWVPSVDSQVLEYSVSWNAGNPELEKFEEFSSKMRLAPGQGLAGEVWVSGQPKWIKDISGKGVNCVREKDALAAGLRAALGVPINAGEDVLAVLVFFAGDESGDDKHMLEVVTAVATQIGSVLEHRKAEAALLEKSREMAALNAELHKLTIEIKRLEDNERRKFAEMLHENIGQNLAAIKMLLEANVDQQPPARKRVKDSLLKVLYLIDESIKATRGLTADLYPAPFKEMGLGSAVTWYVESFVVPKGIKAEIDIDESAAIFDEEKRQVLFRIIRESLQNALKHASASRVTISLKCKGGRRLLSIEDDGVGFDTGILNRDRGFGLILMREWVKSIGGRFSAKSTKGVGTRIIAELDLRKEEK